MPAAAAAFRSRSSGRSSCRRTGAACSRRFARGDWASAQAGIAALARRHPEAGRQGRALHRHAIRRGSSFSPLLALLAEAPELPQAGASAAHGPWRAARIELPAIPLCGPHGAARQRAAPASRPPGAGRSRRRRACASRSSLWSKTDSAPEAEALYVQSAADAHRSKAGPRPRSASPGSIMSSAATPMPAASPKPRASRRRRRMGSQANWIAGLASWRLNDCEAAARHFRAVATGRAESRAGRGRRLLGGAVGAGLPPAAARSRPCCRAAARSPESFYGLLARETLGMDKALPGGPLPAPGRIENLPNVRRALRLAEIGEYRLADEMLRHQARDRPGRPIIIALIALAKRIDFAGVQYLARPQWPARRARAGRRPLPHAALAAHRRLADRPGAGLRPCPPGKRLPSRRRQPGRRGRPDAGAARARPAISRGRAGRRSASLAYPPTNLEYGQSFIELMRRNPATQGQLPKVVAAYNAGPLPVAAGTTSTTRAIPCCGSRACPIGKPAITCPRCCGTCGSISSSKGRRSRASRRWPSTTGPHFPTRRR